MNKIRPTYIYKLIKDNEIVYVGKSVNPSVRSNSHRRDKQYDRVEISPVGYTDSYASELEEQLIIFYDPKYNQHIKSRGNYESVSYFLRYKDIDESYFRSVLNKKYKVFKDNYTQQGLHQTAQLIGEGKL